MTAPTKTDTMNACSVICHPSHAPIPAINLTSPAPIPPTAYRGSRQASPIARPARPAPSPLQLPFFATAKATAGKPGRQPVASSPGDETFLLISISYHPSGLRIRAQKKIKRFLLRSKKFYQLLKKEVIRL